MNPQNLFLAALLCLLFAACKKEEGSDDIKADIKTFYSLQNKIAAEFQATLSDTITDEFAHSERLLAWIQQQPDVEEAVMHWLYVFDVKHKNGLSGNILFTPKQTDVHLMTRGGGGGTDGRLHAFKTSDEDKIITNKNVLVIVQSASDFYAPYCRLPDAKHIQTVLDLFEYADIDFDVTLKVDEGLSAFMNMSDYGIIIINTHGTPTGLCSGEDIFNTENLVSFLNDVEVADLPDNAASRLRNEELKLTSFWEYEKATNDMTIKNASYELTFNFFQSLPVQFDNTVLIGNYCYSGIQNGIMGDILAPKGLKSFYGYGYANGIAYPVTNHLAWRAEDTIITNLIILDTTGIAHLANNTTQLQDDKFWQNNVAQSPTYLERLASRFITGPQTLNHHLDPGYHFEKCGDTLTDSRDGRQYPTVCIGNQVWMAKNLNYANAGVCYDNIGANCNRYGRLYSIAELTNLDTSSANPSTVRGLCPEGWHVPSTAEWIELFEAVNSNAGKLCAPSDWPLPNNNTNETGLTLVPGGFYVVDSDTSIFAEIDEYGRYWSSSRTSDGQFFRAALLVRNNVTNLMSYNANALSQNEDFANYGTKHFSCRCVKD